MAVTTVTQTQTHFVTSFNKLPSDVPRALLQVLSVLCRKTCWAARAVTSALTSSFPKLCSPSRMGFSLCCATCSLSLVNPCCAPLTVPVVLSAGMCCGSDPGGRAKATCGAGGIKLQPMHTGTHTKALWLERKGFSHSSAVPGEGLSRAEHTNAMQSGEH